MRRRKNPFALNFGKVSEAKKKLVRYGSVSRASAARELNPKSGLWVEVAADVPRFVMDLPDYSHGTHGLLSEFDRNPATIYSADFSQATWGVTNVIKTSTALTSVIAGKTAARLTTTVAGGYMEQTFTALGDEQAHIHAVVEAGTSETIQLELRKSVGPASMALITFTFATGEASVTSGDATGVRAQAIKTHAVGPNGGTVWVVMVAVPDGTEVAGIDTLRLYPSGAAGTDATIVHNLNVHDRAGFSPIVNGAATAVQPEDVILTTFPRVVAVETTGVTIILRYRQYMSAGAADTLFAGASIDASSALGTGTVAGTEVQSIKRENNFEFIAANTTEALMETRVRILSYKTDELIELSGGAVTTNALDDHTMEDQTGFLLGGFHRTSILECIRIIHNKLPATSLSAYYS